jgi:hypothetical protein
LTLLLGYGHRVARRQTHYKAILSDKYTGIGTVPTFAGAKTIAVDTASHNAYLFHPERGPAPAPAPGTNPAPAAGGRCRGPQGPIIAAWFIAIKQ